MLEVPSRRLSENGQKQHDLLDGGDWNCLLGHLFWLRSDTSTQNRCPSRQFQSPPSRRSCCFCPFSDNLRDGTSSICAGRKPAHHGTGRALSLRSLPRLCNLRLDANEFGQTPYATENEARLLFAANGDSKRFFDAEGKFENVKGVEVKVAASESLVVSNAVRHQDIEPENVGHEALQLR